MEKKRGRVNMHEVLFHVPFLFRRRMEAFFLWIFESVEALLPETRG